MTAPPPVGTAMAVICHTCAVNVWQGDVAQGDGQVLLSAFADSVTGTACPSKVDPCPNKTVAVAAAKKTLPAAVLARIAAIEAKVGMLPATKP